MISWGLDTSHWEGITLPIIGKIIARTGKVNNQELTSVHFDLAYQSGCRFALIKATDGIDVVDEAWTDSAQKAHDSKLVVFPFHFYQELDYLLQLDWYRQNIAGKFDGLAVVDYEISPKNPKHVLSELAMLGIKLQDAYHLTPLLYTSPYYLSLFGSLDLTPLLVYNLWLAWWNPGFIMSCYPWAGYLARQWTNKGKLPGLNSSVDLDYMLDDPHKIVELSQI